ncbi:MAG TPA: cytochrome C [Desulfuromonadales bacterium]|nr:cytochrome C [Desulfuromonadales bacterium]
MKYRTLITIHYVTRTLLSALLLVITACLVSTQVSAQGAAEPVCITCHSTLPEKYSLPVTLWRTSIHAENGIFCSGCHGGDPQDAVNAMSPARGFLGAPKEPAIPAFCGRCHVGVLKDYLTSAHGRMLGKGGPTCVTCHGNHHIIKASLELINEKSCSRCHSFDRARTILASMQNTEAMIVALDMRLIAFKSIGTDTEKLEKELFTVRNHFHSLFHNVNVDLVTKESVVIQAELYKIRDALVQMDTTIWKRKMAGAGVVSLMLLIAAVLHIFKKNFKL